MAPYPEVSQLETYNEDNLSDSEEFKKDVDLLKKVAPSKSDDTDQCPKSDVVENDTTSRDIASINDEQQEEEEILSDTTSEEREIIEKMPNDFFLRPMEF